MRRRRGSARGDSGCRGVRRPPERRITVAHPVESGPPRGVARPNPRATPRAAPRAYTPQDLPHDRGRRTAVAPDAPASSRSTSTAAAGSPNASSAARVAVTIEGHHLCLMMRGAEKQRSMTVASATPGAFAILVALRDEFGRLVTGRAGWAGPGATCARAGARRPSTRDRLHHRHRGAPYMHRRPPARSRR
ncbi:MAG: GTP cyclohydrolase I [Gemmatimonadota bacterium]